MRYIDFKWGEDVDGPTVRVFVVSEMNKGWMRSKLVREMECRGWKGTIKKNWLGCCVEVGTEGDLYLIGVSGETILERLGVFSHEALHLVEDHYKGRRLPGGKHKYDREELKCRMLETLVKAYAKYFEEI